MTIRLWWRGLGSSSSTRLKKNVNTRLGVFNSSLFKYVTPGNEIARIDVGKTEELRLIASAQTRMINFVRPPQVFHRGVMLRVFNYEATR